METTDDFERRMRDVLQGADDEAAGFTAEQVIARGQHRRRARTAAVSGVALVAAGAVAVVPSALVGGSGHGHGAGQVVTVGGGLPAPIATTKASVPAPSPPNSALASSLASPPASGEIPSTPPSSSAPRLRIMPPGYPFKIGSEYTLTLTTDSMTIAGHGGQTGPLSTDNGNQGPDSISLQTTGTVVSGLYIGSGQVASGKITVNGRVYGADIATLSDNPGWSVAYVVLPAFPTGSMSISVYDAAGHQLATYAPPTH